MKKINLAIITFIICSFSSLECHCKYEMKIIDKDPFHVRIPKKIDDLGNIYFTKLINNQGAREIEIHNIETQLIKIVERTGLDVCLHNVSNNGKIIGTELQIENINGERKNACYAFTWDTENGKRYLFNKLRQDTGPVYFCINNSHSVGIWNWSWNWLNNLPDNLKKTAQNPSFFVKADQLYPTNFVCFPNPDNSPSATTWYTIVCAINNHNDFTGTINFSYYSNSSDITSFVGRSGEAFFWDTKNRTQIRIRNIYNRDGMYSNATDINDLKQVVGASEVDLEENNIGVWHAFLWENGHTMDLGTLGGYKNSAAYAINNSSEIIGVCCREHISPYALAAGRPIPFIWTEDSGMIDLNTLILDKNDILITIPIDINNRGDILCYAHRNDGSSCVVVLEKNNCF